MVPEAPRRLDGKLRFDVYEADPRSGELRKHGIRIPLEDRPFRALLIFLRHGNELVTREELQKLLWPNDVFVDFDHGLNTVIRKIRRALNDSADEPRFIETVGGRGYRFLASVEQQAGVAPKPAAAESSEAKPSIVPGAAQEGVVATEQSAPATSMAYFGRRRAMLAIGTVAVVLLLAFVFRPAMPFPRVSRIVQLTKSGGVARGEALYTDGPRVYYQSIGPLSSDWQLTQVLLNGNEVSPAGVPAGRFRIQGLWPDDTEFLALSLSEPSTVWRIPVANGSPRRIGNLLASDIALSHDGQWLAYAHGNQLFLAKSDGESSRPLASVGAATGEIDHVRWSPDDQRLRFTLNGAALGGTLLTVATQALWEIGADGHNLHELRFNWPGPAMECCGEWTLDGGYFVFSSSREGISNLWALEEKSHWWRRANREPVQLTSGPVNYTQPLPSRNGKGIFAIGAQPSGELVRYDASRRDFVPFLGGRSLAQLAFSRDGQWLAYIEYPEGTLWRARSDGTEPLQLTFPPLQVGVPCWSPDGKRIAFHAKQPGQLWKNFLISSDGGNPEPFPSEPFSETNPSWMPADDSLIYSHGYREENPGLYKYDLRLGHSEKISGSDGLYGPRWSRDGRYLAAVDASNDVLFLVDLKTGKRAQIAGQARWPTWSADSQYIYFVRDGVKWILRVRVPDGKEEKFLEVPFRLNQWPFTLAPDGSPIMLREHGRYDVYSLALSVP